MTIETDFEGFKIITKEILENLPKCKTVDQTQAAGKGLWLSYFGLKAKNPNEEHQAEILTSIIQKKINQREIAILFTPLHAAL